MELRPYKFVVQAITQRVEDGEVVGEAQTEPVELFGCDQLERWAREFPAKLAAVATPGEPAPK